MRSAIRRLGMAMACLATLPAAAQDHTSLDHASLDGVWKQVPAQAELVPEHGGKVPFTTEGQARYRENRSLAARRDNSYDQTASICSSPGLPRLMLTPERLRIFQRDTVVTMQFEWNHLFRQIEMRKVSEARPEVDSMTGVSHGHWDGDTLIVHSFGFFPDKLLDRFKVGSGDLQLTERIRLVDADTLEDRITITDPQYFTQPWETVLTYRRQADEPFAEDSCLDRKKAGKPTL